MLNKICIRFQMRFNGVNKVFLLNSNNGNSIELIVLAANLSAGGAPSVKLIQLPVAVVESALLVETTLVLLHFVS